MKIKNIAIKFFKGIYNARNNLLFLGIIILHLYLETIRVFSTGFSIFIIVCTFSLAYVVAYILFKSSKIEELFKEMEDEE